MDMSDPDLVVPDAISASPETYEVWSSFADHVKNVYSILRRLGIRKEDARFVLPNAAKTRIVMTMNFRELRHFFRLRLAPEAQWEIRRVALEVLKQLAPHAPTVFGDMLAEVRDECSAFCSDEEE